MTTSITWVDAFSARLFGGNPAAVCLPESPLSEADMQSIAFELGIAETAYVSPADRAGEYHLRWFSPATEIDLCGHATLASAHAMRERGVVDGIAPITFHTRSGPLIGTFDGDLIALDFPAAPMTTVDLAEPLRAEFEAAGVVTAGRTSFFDVVILDSSESVRTYQLNRAAIASVPAKAVLLMAPGAADSEADYVLRVFGPNVGIDEDPATGSAQCVAGPYWSEVLHKSELVAHQLSPRRAVLYVRPEGNRVHISGHAVTVLSGHLC
jgi:PhzF family phenazine biosynthesis protein